MSESEWERIARIEDDQWMYICRSVDVNASFRITGRVTFQSTMVTSERKVLPRSPALVRFILQADSDIGRGYSDASMDRVPETGSVEPSGTVSMLWSIRAAFKRAWNICTMANRPHRGIGAGNRAIYGLTGRG